MQFEARRANLRSGGRALTQYLGGDALMNLALSAAVYQERVVRMGMHVDEAGHNGEAGCIDDAACAGVPQFPHGGNGVPANAEVGVIPRVAASVDYAAVAYQHVERVGLALEGCTERESCAALQQMPSRNPAEIHWCAPL